MTEKKKNEEKKPLDLTTEEAMSFLFPPEVVEQLKGVAQGNPPPASGDGNGSKSNRKSARKHDTI